MSLGREAVVLGLCLVVAEIVYLDHLNDSERFVMTERSSRRYSSICDCLGGVIE